MPFIYGAFYVSLNPLTGGIFTLILFAMYVGERSTRAAHVSIISATRLFFRDVVMF